MNEARRTCVGLMAVALMVVSCAGPEVADPGAWPQWRGPSGQGVSADVDLPVTWGAGSPNIKWTATIPGIGNSSPIVSGGRVFLTSAYSSGSEGVDGAKGKKGKKRQVVHFLVIGVDVATGEVLWETEVATGGKTKKHWLNTFAAPTPVTDGERVLSSSARPWRHSTVTVRCSGPGRSIQTSRDSRTTVR